MRLSNKISLGVLSVICAVVLLRNPIVAFIARGQIGKIFPGANVSIGSCDFNPFSYLCFTDIRVSRARNYDLKAGRLEIRYRLPLLMQRSLLLVLLSDASIKADTPYRNSKDLLGGLNLRSSGRPFSVDKLDISKLIFNINSADFVLDGDFSISLKPEDFTVYSLAAGIRRLETPQINLEGLSLESKPNQGGEFRLVRIGYNKLKATGITARADLFNNVVTLTGISLDLLEGKVMGQASFKLGPVPEYFLSLKASGVSLERLSRDLEFGERFQATGMLKGSLRLKGEGAVFRVLDGDFSAEEPGGTLEVRDPELLRRIAASTSQPLDILMENFRDYHYNTGMFKAGLDGGNVVLNAEFEGEAGKRSLTIVLHDLFNKEAVK